VNDEERRALRTRVLELAESFAVERGRLERMAVAAGVPQCAECGVAWLDRVERWRLVRVDLLDEGEGPELLAFCPRCSERDS
jgi:hypothetical protein